MTIQENTFDHLGIAPRLLEILHRLQFTIPTPIQQKSIPVALEGKDIIGVAQTGTGKTLAFGIPMIQRLAQVRGRGLVILPTRELAVQVDETFQKIGRPIGLRTAILIGGASMEMQMRALRKNPHVIIGTPGRILDHLQKKTAPLHDVTVLVLDEADRMLDMGFIKDMRFILAHMPKERHTLFFSATLSREIEQMIGEFLSNPVRVSVKTGDTATSVQQDVVRVLRGQVKIDVLHELLSQPAFSKVLVFGRTKHGVEKLSKLLAQKGFKAESIHGNKNHSRRQKALGLFKDNRVQILVATDVAARGLDIADVSHVINYDIPATYDDYVHRIGRTGRGNKKGKALTFVE